jgi:hypothetical protein
VLHIVVLLWSLDGNHGRSFRFSCFLFKLGVERASVHVFLVDIHQGLRVTPIASQHLAVLPWRGSIQPGEGIPGEMSMLVCSRFPG